VRICALLSTPPRAADDAAIKQQNATTDHQAACAFPAKDGGNPAKASQEGRSNGDSLFEHDLFGKPVSTFPDHAVTASFLF
jgi:hypothetical protein